MTDSSGVTALKTSISHRCYGLVKVSYGLFAVLFIYCFSDPSWFGLPISVIGLPIILLFLVLAHFILLFLESPRGVRLFSPLFFKGAPPVFYRRWMEIYSDDTENDTTAAVAYGLKRVRLDLVDSLELTLWGSLLLKSVSIQGRSSKAEAARVGAYQSQILARFPLGAASQADQKTLVEVLKKLKPDLVVNQRLQKRLDSKIVRGEEMVKTLGAAFLFYVLLDLGFATSSFLEMQKHYFLSQSLLRTEEVLPEIKGDKARRKRAEQEFARAEEMREGRLPISLVQRALFDHGSAACGVWQARGEALFYLDKKDEAIKSLEKAHKLYPRSLKLMIELARWKLENGDTAGCRSVLARAIKDHEEDLLPCLYMIAADKKDNQGALAIRKKCKEYLNGFDENVFGSEPWWPPGGNRFMSERYYRDDLLFLSRVLLDMELD